MVGTMNFLERIPVPKEQLQCTKISSEKADAQIIWSVIVKDRKSIPHAAELLRVLKGSSRARFQPNYRDCERHTISETDDSCSWRQALSSYKGHPVIAQSPLKGR